MTNLDLFDPNAGSTGDDKAVALNKDGTPKTKADKFDQYYTRAEVAEMCMNYIRENLPFDEIASWLEPSAGTGAFYTRLPEGKRIGLDIDEEHKHPEVLKQDFTKWGGGHSLATPVATVGNPPFGKNSSLALQFVNRAAGFSDWICMILPRTFDKQAMQNKVSLHHELVRSYPLAPFSFEYEGNEYDVPCCFQIWRRKANGEKRNRHSPFMDHQDFKFVADHKEADFAFQRVGVNAGLASREGLTKSWKSNHFIKVRKGLDPDKVMADLNSIDWKAISGKTAGNPSIGKGEMIEAYSEISPRKDEGML